MYEKLLLIVVTIFILDIFVLKMLDPIQHFGRFLVTIESRVYDSQIRSRDGARQDAALKTLRNSLDEGKFEKGSKQFKAQFDNLAVDTKASKDVAVIAIDEKTMEEVGQWPIRRDTYEKLLHRVFEVGGAKAISFDIVFSERGDQTAINEFKNLRPKLSGSLQKDVDESIEKISFDQKMESAFDKFNDKIIAGYTTLSLVEVEGKDFSDTFFNSKRFHAISKF